MSSVGYTLAWLAPNALWIGIVIYLITHPEVAEKWGAIFSSLFSRISRGAERASVALDIQGRIDGFSKSLNAEVAGIMPYGVKIEWVTEPVTRESFFKDKKVILRMGYHTNQDENFVHAAVEYVTRGMLPDSRPHVDERVMKSTDLICTKKLIERERRSALQFYYGEILNPTRRSDDELNRYVLIMQNLDELGYFSQILLRELQDLGVKMQFSIPDDAVKDETKRFADFLDGKIVKKEPGVDVDPTFLGEQIRTSIVYVARRERIEPHLRWIKRCIDNKVDTIYLCARGAQNISLVKDLEERLQSEQRLTKRFENVFRLPLWRGRARENICVRYNRTETNSEPS